MVLEVLRMYLYIHQVVRADASQLRELVSTFLKETANIIALLALQEKLLETV